MNVKLLIIASLFLYGQNTFAQDLLDRQATHEKTKSSTDENAANVDASLIPISDYFFPLYKFYYTTELAGENAMGAVLRSEYKICNSATIGQYLEMKTEMYINAFSHTTASQCVYVLSKSKTKNAIISTRQAYYNKLTGPQTYNDSLTLFILPKKGQVEKWAEVNRGERYSCTAEYVEISFFVNGEEQNASSVKLTKITKVNNKEIKQWSYWVPNLSKIVSFEKWGTDEAKTTEMSCLLDERFSVKEIGQSLKLSYEEPKTATKKSIPNTTRNTSSRNK